MYVKTDISLNKYGPDRIREIVANFTSYDDALHRFNRAKSRATYNNFKLGYMLLDNNSGEVIGDWNNFSV